MVEETLQRWSREQIPLSVIFQDANPPWACSRNTGRSFWSGPRHPLSDWNNIEILSVDLKTCWVCSLKYLRSWGVEQEEVATKSLWKLWYQPRSLFWRVSFLLTACWRAGINFKNQLKLDQEPSVLSYYPESQGAAFTAVILCDQSPFLFICLSIFCG